MGRQLSTSMLWGHPIPFLLAAAITASSMRLRDDLSIPTRSYLLNSSPWTPSAWPHQHEEGSAGQKFPYSWMLSPSYERPGQSSTDLQAELLRLISPCKAYNFGKDYKANKDSKTNKQSMTNKDSKANKVYKTNKNSKTFSRETTLIDIPSAEVNVYGYTSTAKMRKTQEKKERKGKRVKTKTRSLEIHTINNCQHLQSFSLVLRPVQGCC